MRERTTIKEAESRGKLEGLQQIQLCGHVAAIRALGKISFLNLRDASGQIQCVADSKETIEALASISPETPVSVTGRLKQGQGESLEVLLESIVPLAEPATSLPVEIAKDKKVDNLALKTLLDYRPITLRNRKVKAIFKIEAAITRAFRSYLTSQGFTEIHTPKIVATGTEGGAQLFALEYFGKTAYLAQSPQFYKQMMVGVFERVFETAAVYRAEEHDTTRHLNEYISLDFEMGFIESELDVIAMQVGLLKHIFAHVAETCEEELAIYEARVPEFEEIPRIGIEDACRLIEKEYGWQPGESSHYDLDPEGERLICEHYREKEGVDLVYILHYPLANRPFYTMPLTSPESNGSGGKKRSRSFDLLFRGLEVTTGGQRIHRIEDLEAAISGRGLDPADFEGYLQCFRYGMPPHGGLAIGLERLAKQLLGLKSVKQAALFPRDLHRLSP
ncbi:MAG: aspartate--tRNA(Asn) ligase [Cyanobacteria bacterium HKST-UBA02]|nr:aspartate--tRNA(Asn) ligase [Cyanobacteria bacterium HKST-UBA02]